MELVEQLDEVEAIIVDRSGAIRISSGLRNRVRFPADSPGNEEAR
jgi:hypothetical protein